MASNKLEEPEFWLPSEFLTDDDILMEHNNKLKNEFSDSSLLFPTEFPYDFAFTPPVLGSPVESLNGSTETESDEDEFLAGLTRHLTRTSLDETLNSNMKSTLVQSGSPQSTLTQVGSWSGRSSGSSNGSPNGPSQVSSPPTTPLGAQNDSWDLIYQAAGQVARLKMNSGYGGPTSNQGFQGPPRRVYPVHSSASVKIPNSCFTNTNTNTHFEQARREQLMRKQNCAMWNTLVKNGWVREQQQQQPMCQNRGLRPGFSSSGGFGRVMGGDSGHQTVWSAPPFEHQNVYQQQHQSPGSVFLGGSVNNGCVVKKKECAGTGVFLPRRYNSNSNNNATDARKKTGCSTAWIPARVVHALNKNFDDYTGIPPPPQPHQIQQHRVFSDYEILMARKHAFLAQQQRRNLNSEGSMNNLEVHLPQEWTY